MEKIRIKPEVDALREKNSIIKECIERGRTKINNEQKVSNFVGEVLWKYQRFCIQIYDCSPTRIAFSSDDYEFDTTNLEKFTEEVVEELNRLCPELEFIGHCEKSRAGYYIMIELM